MGIGFDFGPPPDDGQLRRDGVFGGRRLTAAQMRELGRFIESVGGNVLSERDAILIEGDCEAFEVRPDGGFLSKPSHDDDELDRLWTLILQVSEWAGWIVTNAHGLVAGATLHCEACGDSGFPWSCPAGHPQSKLRLVVHDEPPPAFAEPDDSALDAVRAAATHGALAEALRALDSPPPLDDARVVLAQLVSRDDALVEAALDAIEALGHDAFKPDLLDARLRRIEMLSEEPRLASRAKSLRRRG